MHFAFAIMNLFPGGGLQRDCVDIAHRVRQRGHAVTIFTSRNAGGIAEDLSVRILPVDGYTNHGRQRLFSDAFATTAAGRFDLLVGFDKLDGLDLLYCSDRSMRARAAKHPLLHLLPRYRGYMSLEKACFAPQRTTEILLLAESQLDEYWNAWRTEPNRLVMLPPTLVPARRKPEYRVNGVRAEWRKRLGLRPDDWVWIATCVQPITKGTDRSVRALRHFPDARLLVVGLDERDVKSAKTRQLAAGLGVADRIKWLGHREDVPELMAAADVFLHPARYDTTGTVILEAIVNGLPVITTSKLRLCQARHRRQCRHRRQGVVPRPDLHCRAGNRARSRVPAALVGFGTRIWQATLSLRRKGPRDRVDRRERLQARRRGARPRLSRGFDRPGRRRGAMKPWRDEAVNRKERRVSCCGERRGLRFDDAASLHRARLARHAIANARPGCSKVISAAIRRRSGASRVSSRISSSRACASLRST
jgi:UDP-glucose:(heptosyl)LPS alpha-1,3-glucosyltransferase